MFPQQITDPPDYPQQIMLIVDTDLKCLQAVLAIVHEPMDGWQTLVDVKISFGFVPDV